MGFWGGLLAGIGSALTGGLLNRALGGKPQTPRQYYPMGGSVQQPQPLVERVSRHLEERDLASLGDGGAASSSFTGVNPTTSGGFSGLAQALTAQQPTLGVAGLNPRFQDLMLKPETAATLGTPQPPSTTAETPQPPQQGGSGWGQLASTIAGSTMQSMMTPLFQRLFMQQPKQQRPFMPIGGRSIGGF